MKAVLRITLCLLGIVALANTMSCTSDEIINPIDRQYLVKSIRVSTIRRSIILAAIAEQPKFNPLIPFIRNDISLYRIVYKTQFKGKEILASGLVSLPIGVENPPILSAQHGTIFSENSTPSNFLVNILSNGQVGFELFGSAGYITFIPDYIGYGQSGPIVHPYFDRASTASSVIDMYRASLEFLEENNIKPNGKLFLFGYSEGGFATLAALKDIEENHQDIRVTAAGAGAGGFHIRGIMNHVLNLTDHPEPGFLGYVMRAYNETYEWNRPYTDFFQEPYASRIEDGLLDGGFDKDEVNAQLTTKIADFINPTFRAALLNGSETVVLDSMTANSVHNWKPVAPVQLYHSPNDEVLTIQNTIDTYNTMQALGAANVEFVEVGGASHLDGAFASILSAIPWFDSLNAQ